MSEPVFVPPSTPRSPRLSACVGSTGAAGLIAGTVLAGVGLLVTLLFLQISPPFWEDWTLDEKGLPAAARAVETWPTGSRVNKRPVWKIVLEYRDERGEPRRGELFSTDHRVIDDARQGRTLQIRYVPGAWNIVRAEGTKRSIFGPFALLPAGFGLLGVAVLFLTLRGVLRRRHLYVWGTQATGRVVRVEPTNMRVNNRLLLRTVYSFHGPLGPQEGSITAPEAPPRGSEVTVLYDMNDPSKNLLPLPGSFR